MCVCVRVCVCVKGVNIHVQRTELYFYEIVYGCKNEKSRLRKEFNPQPSGSYQVLYTGPNIQVHWVGTEGSTLVRLEIIQVFFLGPGEIGNQVSKGPIFSGMITHPRTNWSITTKLKPCPGHPIHTICEQTVNLAPLTELDDVWPWWHAQVCFDVPAWL